MKNKTIIITIIPKPANVFKMENPGIGEKSNGKKNFAKDSGIVRTFTRNAFNPNSAKGSEKFPIAIVRNQSQNIPEITYSISIKRYIFLKGLSLEKIKKYIMKRNGRNAAVSLQNKPIVNVAQFKNKYFNFLF
ncbi:MAG: hypothetical protein ABR968_00720 [Bacteroidales bacterium]